MEPAFSSRRKLSLVKKLEATIKPYLLDDLKQALQDQGLVGMTVSEIKDFSRTDVAAGTTLAKRFVPRLKIEIVVADVDIALAVEIIQRSRLVIGPEDFLTIQDLDDVIRIRTAEHGATAI